VGVGDPWAAQEVAHLARHVRQPGDGRAGARRRSDRHQGQRRAPQLPQPHAQAGAPKDVQAAAATVASSPDPPCHDDAENEEEPAREQATLDCDVANNAAPFGGDIGLESLDCTFLDVPDALLDFGFMFSPPPLPSYCGSPWDDVADDFCFQEPLLLWEYWTQRMHTQKKSIVSFFSSVSSQCGIDSNLATVVMGCMIVVARLD
jgi:hypothetical protein